MPEQYDAQRELLKVGKLFDTLYEEECQVTSEPDSDGNFNGMDSDGVEVQYHVGMVVDVYDKEVS